MSEALTPAGTKPQESLGIRVEHRPSAPWEYRMIQDDNGTVEAAEVCCVNPLCKGLVRCKADARGANTIGAQVCPHCGKKAYVRIDGIWFEVS